MYEGYLALRIIEYIDDMSRYYGMVQNIRCVTLVCLQLSLLFSIFSYNFAFASSCRKGDIHTIV